MHSAKPSSWAAQQLFRALLAILGLGMMMACRLSVKFRNQVTRELSVQIGSADGVYHHYAFTPRALHSRTGAIEDPTLALSFDNAWLGIKTLISPRAVGRIVDALLVREAEYQGNAVLLLWFYGLTRFVLPFGRTRRLQPAPPDAYIACNLDSSVADRIVREPAVDSLDPAWEAAHRQHAKMIMIRGSSGEAVAMW